MAHSRPIVMKQSLISLLWTSLEMNFARIKKKVENRAKFISVNIPVETHLHE